MNECRSLSASTKKGQAIVVSTHSTRVMFFSERSLFLTFERIWWGNEVTAPGRTPRGIASPIKRTVGGR